MSRNEELPPELPVPPPLLTVKLVLGAKAIHDAHILNLISGFVDSAVEMAFCDACKLKSVALLERIWNASLPETFPSPADLGPGNGGKWSRRKYLRTDKHYNRFQFRCGIIEAASIEEKHKAMEMVQWLYDHFHGCIVPLGAVGAAAGHGHLEILQYFKDHEIPGTLGDDRDDIKAEEGHVVRWGRHDMEAAAENSHFNIVWWLHKHAPAPRYLNGMMASALRSGNLMMLEWIQTHYLAQRNELRATNATDQSRAGFDTTVEELSMDVNDFMVEAVKGGQVVVMEWLLDNGYGVKGVDRHWDIDSCRDSAISAALKKNRHDILDWLIEKKAVEAGRIIQVAAAEGRLDVAKDFYACYWHKVCAQPDYPLEPLSQFDSWRREPLWVTAGTMTSAVRSGQLDLVQWLFDTFNGAVDLFQSSTGPTNIIDIAAECGKLEMVKCLHEISILFTRNAGRKRKRGETMCGTGPTCSTSAMDHAASRNRLDIVQWLHATRKEGCTRSAMDSAAVSGHLAMVQWLHSHRSECCSTLAMDGAARYGKLEVVQWLHSHRSEGCTTAAMDGAARYRQLQVLKWLHENTSAGCTTEAMDVAATHGALNIVQWLHHNRSEGCTTTAVDGSVGYGNIVVAKWLLQNRPEGCTTKAMDNAARRNLELVRWFHEHRSEGCTTAAMDGAAVLRNFDVVLFLHSQRREGCSHEVFEILTKTDPYGDIRYAVADSRTDNIYDWLVEHYPDARHQ